MAASDGSPQGTHRGSHRRCVYRRNSSVATATIVDGHFVIDLWSEDESGDDWGDPHPGLLSALIPIRNELMAGDYRALYFAWRLCVQAGEIDPDVPALENRFPRSALQDSTEDGAPKGRDFKLLRSRARLRKAGGMG